MTTIFGDTPGNLTDRQNGSDQSLIERQDVSTNDSYIIYGDASALKDKSVGGNDVLDFTGDGDGLGVGHLLIGDGGEMYDRSRGGDDVLTATGDYFIVLYGDGASMYDNSKGGDDILTVTGNFFNFLYGDGAFMYENSKGGDDILTAEGNDNTLFGDASFMFGDAVGGDDHLTAMGSNNTLYGDAGTMLDNAMGGADTFHFNGEGGTNTIGDFRSGDGDKISIDGTGLSWADLSLFITTGDFTGLGAAGQDTRIDIGEALGEGSSVIIVAGVTDLQESDFLFV
jgi:hypothetical protein